MTTVTEIDTRHGTANAFEFSHGNTLPYTGVPWGMNYFAPQTGTDKRWWFHNDDRVFRGYRLTHQPSPWMGDFSYLVMTPITGELASQSFDSAGSIYRGEESIFNPHRLQIKQLRFNITSRLIGSKYGGVLEIDYPDAVDDRMGSSVGVDPGLLLTLPGASTAEQVDSRTLTISVVNFEGCEDPNFRFYVVFQADHDFSYTQASSTADLYDSVSGSSTPLLMDTLRLRFGNDVHRVTIRFGTSFISSQQANLNLSRERHQSVDEYEQKAAAAWNDWLGRIEVIQVDNSKEKTDQIRTFYHNLYRTALFPQVFYEIDADGRPGHYDTTSRRTKPGYLYTNNGFWDTFRTVYPLYSLIAVDEYAEMLAGFLQSYRNSGYLPKWLSPDERGLMPGTLGDCVIADAAVKDICPELMPEFLRAMIKGATVQSDSPYYGRHGTNEYEELGYVPLEIEESVNHTLDYALSDYCISVVAGKIGDNETAAKYRQRALNYRNLFDPESKFMRARDVDGNFRTPFGPARWGTDYTEGSAWQTSWSVLHDVGGLIDLYGSPSAFTERLIELFNQPPIFDAGGYGFQMHEMSELAALDYGQFAISNQPSFHYPYLAAYVGKPWLTTPLLRNVMTDVFDSSPTGFPGDEDNGTMAAWYIFSSLGFYPVAPGSGEYVIGIPLWDKALIHLSNGNTLTVTAKPNKKQDVFVNSIKRNSVEVEDTFFRHDDLMTGGDIRFKLGIVPREREYTNAQLPYSMSRNLKI